MNQNLSEIFKSCKNRPDALIGVLQKIQDKIGYIPEDSIEQISKFLKISRSKIFGVASFYSQFKFT
ncbi:MAG: NAD(P)H-dependent oxidoreductase subunit E, partial [Elusimicrobia bacterium]|nr:NAD(P)H-dependent oxidoreductase subunit E [Elusimicrobiota bacterium]